jgi:glycosyltransferase involved in cell wall biosynthesis
MSGLMSMEMYYRNAFINPRKYIDGFMFVSNFSKNKHFEHEPRFRDCRCVTMYNFQDASVLANVDDTIDTYDSYYLFYGRLSEEKGIKTLIQTMKQLPNLKLKIVGTGPLEDELKQFCVENKLGDVEFLGFKSGDELFDLVRRAKFTCVTSECWENNPMTIIESYTLRTPVIGAAIGGITEIIKDGETGYSFESGSVEDLSRAIGEAEALSQNEYNTMKSNAMQFATDNFGKESYYTKLMELYKSVINN